MNLADFYITINPVGLTGAASSTYVSQVTDHLRWIWLTRSGRLLLNSIRRPSFPIEIRPYTGPGINAIGGGEIRNGAKVGVVMYSPGLFDLGGVRDIHDGSHRGFLWDEILYHELVHVFRNATGKWNKRRSLSYNMRHYDDNEEFIGVLCANIYIADRSNKIKSGLRESHSTFGAMGAEEAARFGLFVSSANAFDLVKGFCDDNPLFTKALATQLGDLVYNPLADYYRYPQVCRAISMFGKYKDARAFRNDLISIGIPASAIDKFAQLGK